MKNSTKKIISILFILVGFIACLLYSVYNGTYMDEYQMISYDSVIIVGNFFEIYWPTLGIGLIMYFMADK